VQTASQYSIDRESVNCGNYVFFGFCRFLSQNQRYFLRKLPDFFKNSLDNSKTSRIFTRIPGTSSILFGTAFAWRFVVNGGGKILLNIFHFVLAPALPLAYLARQECQTA